MASSPDSAPSPPSPPPPSDDASPPPSQNSPPPPSSGSPPPPSSGSPPPPSSSSPPPPQTDSSPPPPNSSPPPSPPPSSSSSSPPPPQQSSPPPPSSNNNNNNNKNNNNNNNNNGNKNNNDNNNNKNNNDNNNNGNKNNNDNNNQNSNDNSNKNNNDNNNTPSFSPPPPLSSSNPSSSGALPPPPPAHKSSTKSSPSHSNGSPSQSSGATDMLPIIVGVTAGVTALLILMLVMFFVVCSKKKKRRDHDQMQYYSDPGKGGNEYYSDTHYPNWHNSPQSMEVSKPPPQGGLVPPPPGAGMGWAAPPPPPPMMTSSEQSSNFSGPRHPPLPPPSPGISLGLSNSSFTYDELAAATNGFSQANLLGQGGFGYVHRGVLASGKVVAVKSLKSGSGQGEREFQAEVEIISRVHHRHLVSLVGYCIADGQRMLVYEFVPNGTLEYHLYGRDRPTMDWAARIRIALGSAKGLAYLHEDCHPRIIHRDIKAANILLDENFEAMVADFGLAKLSSDNYTHVSTRVMGTFGYLAPEYASSGKLTEKSDVFSYGVMLLELITGRRPVDTTNSYMEDSLVDWARPILTRALGDGNYDELVDPRLGNNYEPHEMARMVACAAASIRHSARRRPKMRQIARALEGDVSLEDLNDGARPGHSSTFNSSTGSSDYDTSSYNADMKKFRKMALESQDMASSEFGATSEYGLNPSSSSGDSSEMSRRPRH